MTGNTTKYPNHLAWAATLLLGMFAVGAAADNKALYIDQTGKVGINNNKPQTTLDVRGEISGIGMVPPGGIVMFSGETSGRFDGTGKGLPNTPYEGWQLCNGNNGAPNLQGRFVVGTGTSGATTYSMGSTGGSEKVSLTVLELASHGHQANASQDGQHFHRLEGMQPDNYVHTTTRGREYEGYATVDIKLGNDKMADQQKRQNVEMETEPFHSHDIDVGPAGSGQPHENRPPYYALAYIMRLPTVGGN